MRTAVRGILVSVPKPDEPTVMVAYPENCIEKVRTIDTIKEVAVRLGINIPNRKPRKVCTCKHCGRDRDNVRFRIYGGMIHAYTKLEYSKSPWPTAIFKCVIPKGTLYYKGTSGDICAKKMLVIEQVK